jgi:hypothetical protein
MTPLCNSYWTRWNCFSRRRISTGNKTSLSRIHFSRTSLIRSSRPHQGKQVALPRSQSSRRSMKSLWRSKWKSFKIWSKTGLSTRTTSCKLTSRGCTRSTNSCLMDSCLLRMNRLRALKTVRGHQIASKNYKRIRSKHQMLKDHWSAKIKEGLVEANRARCHFTLVLKKT